MMFIEKMKIEGKALMFKLLKNGKIIILSEN
jgi:hypothetical protein